MMQQHLEVRLSQRNISPQIIALVLIYGRYIRDGTRFRAIVLKRDLRYLCAEGLPERLAKKVQSTMVIADAFGSPVTAYHPTQAKLRRTKYLMKNIFHEE